MNLNQVRKIRLDTNLGEIYLNANDLIRWLNAYEKRLQEIEGMGFETAAIKNVFIEHFGGIR